MLEGAENDRGSLWTLWLPTHSSLVPYGWDYHLPYPQLASQLINPSFLYKSDRFENLGWRDAICRAALVVRPPLGRPSTLGCESRQ